MFENLTDKLERSFKLLKGQGKITEINVAETLKDVSGGFEHLPSVNDAMGQEAPLLAQKQIIGYGDARDGAHFLRDGANAVIICLIRAFRRIGLAIQLQRTAGRRIDAGDDID